MDDLKRTDFLERQLAYLEEEKNAALEALDLARDLGTFAIHTRQRDGRRDLLGEICARAHKMLPLVASAIYLLDEQTRDFTPVLADPPQAAAPLDDEVRELIADQSFAFALLAGGPTFFLSRDKTHHLLFHALATHSRICGMFVARLAERKESVSDISLKLFSVVMLSAAHALENLEVQRFMENHARELDRQVKERTAELTEAYERLRTTVDGMQAGVLLIDPGKRLIVDANPQALRMVGLPRDQIIGHRCTEYFCPAQENACPVLDLGQSVDSAERIMRNAAGEAIPILKTVSRVMVGGREHLVESFIDITQQKKLEKLREDVNRIVRHDLKGPLNGIIGLPAMLLATGGNLTDEQREGLQYIKSAGYKLLKMINMSLDLYKMETGNYVYEPERHDLMAVVRDVVTDQADTIRSCGLKMAVTLDGREAGKDDALLLRCEESLLYSMLSNLVKNALEGSGFGDTVRLDIRRDGENVVLAVHNARPVPEDIRDTVFDKYATSGKRGGTGLGTYSARLIAETMGGAIACESSEENGTTMTVTLPDRPA
ncbi:MAG: ATP-binding protein [Pseudodesulfovibrio sp.]